jgi:hypothetical protein
MLSAGSRLGPYEILAPLGAGGMGEVYKARAISSLSHPHICALHDVGSQDGVEYLVMEYLESETLAERLSKGALPLAQLLGFSIEIADALDKAHRQGIVHRDLKPGNVMLTKSGVKLLDFGLAKAFAPASQQSALTALPTVAGGSDLTQEGTILGTFQYMAPGQLEGKEADGRTDIFALGAVLYEMATGRKAFEGSSQASLFSAILRDEPRPISQAQPMTPSELDRVVKTCVAKDPNDRWQSAQDVATELKWIAKGGSQTGMPVAARPALRARIAWMLAAVFAAVAAVALLLASRPGRNPESLAFRQLTFRREAIFQAAFAVEQDTVVYSAAVEGNTPQIFTVRPDYPEPQSLGPRGMHLLAVSSRGELAVFIGARYVWHRLFTGTLARMSLSGGAPQEILEGVRQADWSPDGEEILFSASLSGGSYIVYAVTPAGRRRIACQAPGGLTIQDVARDGRWLATRVDFRYRAMVHTPGAAADRDLSWLNTSHARALSQDGQTLLFGETALGTNYAVCLRKTDGSPVVRLGDGWPADLSADRAGLLSMREIFVTDDLRSYAYTTYYQVSSLFVSEGRQ